MQLGIGRQEHTVKVKTTNSMIAIVKPAWRNAYGWPEELFEKFTRQPIAGVAKEAFHTNDASATIRSQYLSHAK